LRIKVIPDFSLRFVDEEFAAENAVISKIQVDMVEYFESRKTELARKGLFALANSFAAIYYIPFQSGMSLHFRFRFPKNMGFLFFLHHFKISKQQWPIDSKPRGSKKRQRRENLF
jgi:hypothetical protein